MFHSIPENVNEACDQMTTQLDLAGLHNAGTESASCGQAIAAPAWLTSCFWDSLVMTVNGSALW